MISIGLLGKKIGMTQIFDRRGHAVAATVLEVGPCKVTAIRTPEKHGYSAVQLGFGTRKLARTHRALKGQFKQCGEWAPQFLREIRTKVVDGLEVGKELKVDLFRVTDRVDIIGKSIGKGFQGVVKRHHFKGGPASHGSMFGRVAGSIGQSSFPSRVHKGERMPGQMGSARVTHQNAEVIDIIPEENLMLVKGSVPGFENEFLEVRMALKKGKERKDWSVPLPISAEELQVEEKKREAGKKKEEKAAKAPAKEKKKEEPKAKGAK